MKSEVDRPHGRALKINYKAESDQSHSFNSWLHASFSVFSSHLNCLEPQKSSLPSAKDEAAAQNTNVNLASFPSQARAGSFKYLQGAAPGFDLDSNRPFQEAQGEFTSDLGHG